MSNKTITPSEGFDLDNPNQSSVNDGPVECLGKTFESDAARREHYLGLLAEKLKDPEFRKIEGFPIGEDEDILNLSDPPYYTACPNPFMSDFIDFYGRPYDPSEKYSREPYAADVSEGKSDPIYNAHSYHTKVPHKAIMRYILHYTKPGDVVFDGFCGTGMTGLAAEMCADAEEVESLGYKVTKNGSVLNNIDGVWIEFSKLGRRKAILNDLGPAPTFIASNYNKPFSHNEFKQRIEASINRVENAFGWVYQTIDPESGEDCEVNYVIFSDVLLCPECGAENVFWREALDSVSGKIDEDFSCNGCSSGLTKRITQRKRVSFFDDVLGKTIEQTQRVPVLINYFDPNGGRNLTKEPDDNDFALIEKTRNFSIPFEVPSYRVPKGDKTGEVTRLGVTHAHHFYTKRNLLVISALWEEFSDYSLGRLLLTSVLIKTASLLHNVGLKNGKINLAGALPNAIYIPSNLAERNLFVLLRGKLDDFLRTSLNKIRANQLVTLGSMTSSSIGAALDSKLDYVFIDPPFGANLMYSELNFIWDSWLRIVTNNELEAIENKTQKKDKDDYRNLMRKSFEQVYRSLKPGRWMTVEFSNTSASVWNNIQTSISDAGFIVSNVSALNKGQGTFNAQTNPTSVKQDLIISAYKPNGGFEKRFLDESDKDGVWDFVRTHLGYLPAVKVQDDELVKIAERDPRILFDQVVAYFVRNNRDVPISSKEFQVGLLERFTERDGMVFLPEQVAEYEKARISGKQLKQLVIFVDDEASAIEWLRQLLNDKTQTYQDIHPKFINELNGWKKAEEQLELSTLLEQNFIKYDGVGPLPAQIHSYLSTNFKEFRNLTKDDSQLRKKAKDRWYVANPEREEDLQKLRDRSLLREFADYKTHTGKKLKKVRMEAVRCGFKKAWQERDYPTIISVAEKIPQDLLQEDQKLLMWYDQAQTRASDENLF